MKGRVLFVDDEPNVLEWTKEMMFDRRQDWEMEFAAGGPDALVLLSETSVDVVVTAMRMQGMTGAELLSEIMSRHPKVIRIILTVQYDKVSILRAMGVAHQYLSKPCDAEKLKAAIGQAFATRELLTNDRLMRLISNIKSLPTMPALYLRIMEELSSPDYTLTRVGEIISRDVGMTAKLLQLVNSAFFGLAVHVSTPVYAAKLLGPEIIKGLIFSLEVFAKFKKLQASGLSLQAFLDHSMAVAAAAKKIAISEGQDGQAIDDTFIAGMLHDTGKLVLAENFPAEYKQALETARRQGLTVWAAEQEVIGATHADVGAYLLGLWGLPRNTIEVAAFHHAPRRVAENTFSSLTAVHVANALEHAPDEEDGEGVGTAIDLEYLEELGLKERLPVWKEQFIAAKEGKRSC